ncbi:MAG TPA: aspartyl/asparaginyl beta-hydroxylase domain-containing protein [Steroidobacteraceae bacterium]|nr:aspartyl/asparaginyl beta-hydroxylase domain-containing protein [Steroidobacteraceae bacterium]
MAVTSAQTPSPDEQKVVELMAGATRLLAEQRDAEALRLYEEAAAISPDHPLVLHERARRLAVGGDLTGARAVLERLTAAVPGHAPFWLSLASVLRALGNRDEELAALERALAADPRHSVALLQKGSLLELMGKPRAAAVIYAAALDTLPRGARLPPPVAAHAEHARAHIAQNSERLAATLHGRLEALRCERSPTELMRFERALDRILGRKRIYTPQPVGMHYPFLRNYEFSPREDFPWLERLEAAAEAIREEVLGVLAADRDSLQPYIAYPEGLPLDQWRELNHSRRWSAYFLWKDGARDDAHCARCPRTVAALAATPQVDIPGRGPTAFFSILDARTHIPPHTGTTNIRLTVHLPLILPGSCRFRVGAETREWRFGEAWVFDDTIEHEAWNDADAPRAILIFDVWNPQLTALERDLVREATVALAEYNRDEGPVPGVSF